MIIVDTDIVSAALKPGTPEHAVVISWLDAQRPEALCVTAVTVFEILSGIERLDAGKRRNALAAAFEQALEELLAGRIFPFDEQAARAAARLTGLRRRSGKPVAPGDTQIAGIAVAHGAAIATRNVKDFADLSVPVINPWAA